MKKELNKVDRALELIVIDWLQWNEFPESDGNKPALALELIAKRKAYTAELETKLAEAHQKIIVASEYFDWMIAQDWSRHFNIDGICNEALNKLNGEEDGNT